MINRQSIPWETIDEYGFFRALYYTIILILFKTNDFFVCLKLKNSYIRSFIFYCILIYPVLFGFAFLRFKEHHILLSSPLHFILVFFFALILPIILINYLAVLATLSARIFRGSGTFRETFSILAYSAATLVISLIPIFGIISPILGIVIGVIGFKQIHKLSIARAIIAYLFFLILAYIVAIVILTFFGQCKF